MEDIQHKVENSVIQDELSQFFESANFDLRSFGKWIEKDINALENYTISDYELVYIIKGSAKLIKNGVEYTANKGHVLLLEPFQIYTAQSIGKERMEYIYLHFRIGPYFLQNEFKELMFKDGVVFNVDDSGILLMMLENTLSSREAYPNGYAVTVKMALIRMLIRMAYTAKQPNIIYSRPSYNQQDVYIISRSITYVAQRLDQPIRVKEIATWLNISESKLYKTFNNIMGMSPSECLMQFKIKKAEEMLLTSDLTIDTISEHLGFSSPFHLSRNYKEVMGISPSGTRKKFLSVKRKMAYRD